MMMFPSTVSNLNKKIYAKIEAWRNRRIEGEHPYDGIEIGGRQQDIPAA
jgi:transposase-like protein